MNAPIAPEETAARFRKALPLARKVMDDTGSDVAKLNYMEAIANAAACHSCAYFERTNKTCHAHPPRSSNSGKGAWPSVNADDWCGCWRRA